MKRIWKSFPRAAAALFSVCLAVGGCSSPAGRELHRVEADCLRVGGGPDWAKAKAAFGSLSDFCHAKGLYYRALYLKKHDPDELAQEHSDAQAQLNATLDRGSR